MRLQTKKPHTEASSRMNPGEEAGYAAIRGKAGTLTLMKRQKYLLLLALPCVLYYIIFNYIPMYGIIMAFEKFDFSKGFLGSQWVGLKNFETFIQGPYFWRLMRNTFLLSVYALVFGFPVPIIFALLLNELRSMAYKRWVQTITYLPHFLSVVIVIGLLKEVLSPSGIVNRLLAVFGAPSINFFMDAGWFRTMYVSSAIWQEFGWGAIIYLAALASIDPQLYEAARIDGASRWRCVWHVTLPSLRPTIIILLILNMGSLLSVSFEKVLLLYSPGIYETADVIPTYVYRVGLLQANYSFGAAVGVLNSVIAFIFVYTSNYLSRKFSEVSIW